MLRYRSGQCNVIGFFLLIGMGIAIVCSSEPVNDKLRLLDADLEPHRAHLAQSFEKLAPRGQAPIALAKANLALELIAAPVSDEAEADRNREAARRIVLELPKKLQRAFSRELEQIRHSGKSLGQAVAAAQVSWNRPQAEPSWVSAEETRNILLKLRQLRSTRPDTCPSESTGRDWQGKVQTDLAAQEGDRINGLQKLQTARADRAKVETTAVKSESEYLKDSHGKLKEVNALYRRSDTLSEQRDQLRRRTQESLNAIFPSATERPAKELFDAAISMVPVFNDYQRVAPLWRYEGLDVRASEAKPKAERFAELDSPEFQKYFVESLSAHPEKNFAFTLTEEGKRALSRPFFPLEKIAVHRLGELDAAQDKSRDLFAVGEKLRGDERAWEARNQGLVTFLKDKLRRKEENKAALVRADGALSEAERKQRSVDQRWDVGQKLQNDLQACRGRSEDEATRHGVARREQTTH